MGPQSLLEYDAVVALLSGGSFLDVLHWKKHNRKSNLVWFSLFQLWFLLWLLSISHNLCSFSRPSCFFWINPCCLLCAMTRGASRLFLTLYLAVVLWCIDRRPCLLIIKSLSHTGGTYFRPLGPIKTSFRSPQNYLLCYIYQCIIFYKEGHSYTGCNMMPASPWCKGAVKYQRVLHLNIKHLVAQREIFRAD